MREGLYCVPMYLAIGLKPFMFRLDLGAVDDTLSGYSGALFSLSILGPPTAWTFDWDFLGLNGLWFWLTNDFVKEAQWLRKHKGKERVE